MAEGQWPEEAKDALVVIREAQDVEAGEWLAGRWGETLPRLSPGNVVGLLAPWQEWPGTPEWARSLGA